MNHKNLNKTPAILLGGALTLGLGGGALAADANPFALTDLGSGYMVAAEGACGEKPKEADENSGAKEKETEGKCGAQKPAPMPEPQSKASEGKCGEGKCGSKG